MRARVTICVAAVLVLAGCGGAGGSGGSGGTANVGASPYHAQAGTPGGKLVYSDWEQVTDLNPLSNTSNTAAQAEVALWQFLWTNGPDDQPVPQLVSEVPTLRNGLVKVVDGTHMDVTVKLLPGLRWSDGQPLTTSDVRFTWQAICDPATAAQATVGFDHIQSMEIRSATEMVWHFGPNRSGVCGLSQDLPSGLYAPYLSLALPVMPEHVLAGTPHAGWVSSPYFTRQPTAVSGPYMVKGFTPGSSAQVVMVPNPHFVDGRGGAAYFGHRPYLDQLIYQIYGDKASQLNALRTGEADIGLDLIGNDLPAARTVPGARTLVYRSLEDELVMFNVGADTTGCAAQQYAASCGRATVFHDDQPLRQALNLATDKETLNRSLVGGLGRVMNGFLVPNFAPWYDSSLPAFRSDVARARRLLTDDGWKVGPDGVRVRNGRRLEFTLTTTSGNPQRAAEEELLGHDWGLVGARVDVSNHPAGEMFPGFGEGGLLETGQFDAALFAYVGQPDPDSWGSFAETSQIPTAANPAGGNEGRWTDQKLNDLFLQGASEIDPARRKATYDAAQVEWARYAGDIDLYQRANLAVATSSAGNFAPGAPQPAYDVWNAADWFHHH